MAETRECRSCGFDRPIQRFDVLDVQGRVVLPGGHRDCDRCREVGVTSENMFDSYG